MEHDKKISILFVCLGNICRSPMAEGIFTHLVKKYHRYDEFSIDSAGTGSWHIGHPPDKRAQETCKNHGIDISKLQARKFDDMDLIYYDIILAMDERNLEDLRYSAQDENQRNKIKLMLSFHENTKIKSVPDPYYGPHDGFEHIFTMLYQSCTNLLATLNAKNNH